MLSKSPNTKSTKELYRNRNKGNEKKVLPRIPTHEIFTPKRKIPKDVLYGYTGHLRDDSDQQHVLGIYFGNKQIH